MKKHIFWICAVAMTTFALSLNAVAQPGGGPGGRGPGGGQRGPGGFGGGPGGFGMGPGGGFVQNPEFAKMLELTPEQTKDIEKVFEDSRREIQEQMRQTPPGAPPNFDEMRQRMERFMDGIQTKTDQILKPEQQMKSREMMFQLAGGLESPMLGVRTLETLNLTDAQKEQVRKVLAERDEALRAGFNFRDATPEEREKFRTDMEARNKKLSEQITALLTPEQKAKAEKLTAEAPALREKLGMPAPGQQRGQQRGQGGPGGQGGYTPGADSWRPGQGAPPGGAAPQTPPSGQPRRGGFPRSDSN